MAYEQQCFGEPLETMPLLFIRLRLVLVQKSLVRFLYPISYQLVTASYIDYDIYSSYALEDRVYLCLDSIFRQSMKQTDRLE